MAKFITEWIVEELTTDPNNVFKEVVSMEAPTPYLWMWRID